MSVSTPRLRALKAATSRGLCLAVLLGALLSAGGATARADTNFVVNDLADTNDGTCDASNCTLREAINAANADADQSAITFAANVRGTIELTQIGDASADESNSAFALSGPVTIQGPGADVLNVRRMSGGNYRIFRVNGGVTASISGLTISNGNTTDNNDGGGILNLGTLTLSACNVTGNVAANYGGGIHARGLGQSLTIERCTISGNTANNNGGSAGGGIDSSGTLNVSNSTISGNRVPNGSRNGGGIWSSNNSPVTLTNCTLTNNSTVGANSAGGFRLASGTLTISNTIVAANGNNTEQPDVVRIAGTVTSGGYNLIGNPGTVAFSGTGDQSGTASAPLDPQLLALALNAPGTTPTHALRISSPAVNAGDTALTVDQRGVARPQVNRDDIGAYELEASNFTPSLVVTTLADEDDGTSDARVGSGTSLREAVIRANSDGVDSAITFAVTGTVSLNSALPQLVDDGTLSISNAQSGGVTISGNNNQGSVQIFFVSVGTDVTLNNLTLSFGSVGSEFGGAIYNSFGTLTITGSTFTDNSAGVGGVIFNDSGTLTVKDSTFANNSARFGGAIYNSAGTLTVTGSTFANNSTSRDGGAIYSSTSDVTNGSSNPTQFTLICNSTFTGNNADVDGGAIYNVNGLTRIESCTIAGNSVLTGGGAGVASLGRNSIVTRAQNSIIADNVNGSPGDATSGNDVDFVSGNINTFASQGTNAIGTGNATGNFNGSGDQTGVTAAQIQLGALASNGGPTQTRALQAGSIAVNAGATDLTQDQRGVSRPLGGADDIGAYESPFAPPTLSNVNVAATEDTTFAFAANSFDSGFSDANAGDTLQSVRVDSLPQNGILNFGGTPVAANQVIARDDLSKLSFVPVANFNGATSFSFNASDGALFAAQSATLLINVAAVNDAPVAAAQNASTDEDASVTIALTASDMDGDKLSYRIVDEPKNGTLSGAAPNLTYAPAANFNGADSFTFVANDGTEDSAPATVSIVVTPVNDAPTFALGADQTVAENAPTQTIANFASSISAGAANESAQTLTFSAIPTNRALFSVQPAISADGTLTYTLAPDTTGSATISVTLRDNGGTDNGGADTSEVRTFAVTVTANPINFGVSLTPAGPFTNQTVTATPVIANATGVTYAYEFFVNGVSVQKNAGNTLDLSRAGFGDKSDRVSVTVSATNNRGGAGSALNAVTVRNSAPFAFSGTATAQSGVETSIAFRSFGNPGGADADRETLSYKRVGGPRNGVASFETGADGSTVLRYTSRAGFVGVETIRFVAVDEAGRTSNIATLGIDVKGQPIVKPTAENASASATAGVSVDVPVTGADPNGGPVTFKRVGGPRNGVGEFVALSNGRTVLRYTSRANFVGVEEVRFVALNSDGRPSNVATIRINVSSSASALRRNPAPSANNS